MMSLLIYYEAFIYLNINHYFIIIGVGVFR
jgi:hypothetical protein